MPIEGIDRSVDWVKNHRKRLVLTGALALASVGGVAIVKEHGQDLSSAFASESDSGQEYTTSFPEIGEIFQGQDEDGSAFWIRRGESNVFSFDKNWTEDALNHIKADWECDIDTTVGINITSDQAGRSDPHDDIYVVVDFCEAAPLSPNST